MGLITNPSNGAGHVAWPQMQNVLRSLRTRHPGFGGVMGWEYFNALPGGSEKPWEWVANMGNVLRTPLSPAAVMQPQIPIRPYDQPMSQLPRPPHPFPAADVKTLQDLGFSQMQAVAALNMTGGNVEYAAGLLFQE
jgi:hypothetical protein